MFFELQKYDRGLHRTEPAAPAAPYRPVSGICRISLLYWAEHCIECAAPACYETCDLYAPRADLRCRRFAFGAFKNKNFPSLRGHGVEIVFKKWAKMEAYGNLRMHSVHAVALGEQLLERAAPFVDFVGKLMARITGKSRWRTATHVALEELVRQLSRTNTSHDRPDAFLLETYNPSMEVVRVQLSFTSLPVPGRPSQGPLVTLGHAFRETLACEPGYSKHTIAADLFGQVTNAGPFLVSLTPEADSEARLVFLCADFVKFSEPQVAPAAKDVKCVVFDLDNTLWRGTLAEGDQVALDPDSQSLLKHLDERGILLSIASKNDLESAWPTIQRLGLADYFLYPQISWNQKSEGVRTIARRLNIGTDSLAFIDDNPFELDEVSRACPEVLCINSSKMASLFDDPRFSGSKTGDSGRRREFYRRAEARDAAQASFGENYVGFLASCEIHLEIEPFTAENSERVAELVQRTNQLNFSGHKHTRIELEEILADSTLEKLVLKSHDRYGSYGTIGFCIVSRTPDSVLIHDLMLSCRVQGKHLERALFQHLVMSHSASGSPKLRINFHSTGRNTPAKNTLESLGFHPCTFGPDQLPGGMILETTSSLSAEPIRISCSCHSKHSEIPRSRPLDVPTVAENRV